MAVAAVPYSAAGFGSMPPLLRVAQRQGWQLLAPCYISAAARTYLQPHYGNVYLSAGQQQEVNIAGTPLP